MKTYSKYIKQSLAALSLLSFLAFGQHVFAASGDLINNIATINYNIGNAAQTKIESSPEGNSIPGIDGTKTVVVEDQLINFAVVRSDSAEVPITPGNTARTQFVIYNIGSGNSSTVNSASKANGAEESVITGLSTSNYSNGTITVSEFLAGDSTQAPNKTPQNDLDDVFTVGSCEIYDAITDGNIIDQLVISPNSQQSVYVQCTAPLVRDATAGGGALVSEDAAEIFFKAQVTQGWDNTAGASAAIDLADNDNTVDGLEFVFLDPIGDDSDGAVNNSIHSDTSGYIIKTANLNASKTASVVSDPINGANNPYAIPGAVVKYIITVENSSPVTSADGVTISDLIADSFNPPNAGSITVTRSDNSTGTKTVTGQNVEGGCGTIGTGTVAAPAVCTLEINVQIKPVQ